MYSVPAPPEDNIDCVDYIVARVGGQLAASRWASGRRSHEAEFITVERLEYYVLLNKYVNHLNERSGTLLGILRAMLGQANRKSREECMVTGYIWGLSI